jgi:hypothetical protein
MAKYQKAFRIVQIVEGAQSRISISHGQFDTFEAAEEDLEKWDPNENVTYTIIPVYVFKKAQ